MKNNTSPLFNVNARIGGTMLESFFKKTGESLGATHHTHKAEVDISWVNINNGKKETLLFLHGFSDRKESFYFPANFLKDQVNLVLPDLPGFGQSTTDAGLTYSLDNYCKWLSGFIRDNHIGPCHLAGNSLGGAVASRLALALPEQIRSLTLVDTAGFYLPGHRSVYDEALEGDILFQVRSVDDYEEMRGRIFAKPPVLPKFIGEYMAKHTMDNHDWYGKVFNDLSNMDAVRSGRETMESLSLNPHLDDFRMKVFLVWGRHDSLFPCQTTDFLAKRMPDAKIHIFDDLGHVPQIEHPFRFAGELSAFLKTVA